MGSENRQNWYQDPPPPRGGGFTDSGGTGRGIFAGMPKPGKAVLWLLILNGVMFLLGRSEAVESSLALTAGKAWQIWRLVTFQFLHAGLFHLIMNMIGLYFLGMVLESVWGPKRFVIFYLACGAFAGVCHIVYMLLWWGLYGNSGVLAVRLIGASGGVFAVVVACAILFPQIRLILLFFPVPIRFAAVLFLAIAGYSVLTEIATGISGGVSHAAHLGGAAAGAFWIWGLPKLRNALDSARQQRAHGAWQRKLNERAAAQAEIDRILEKIKREGLNSLSAREKKTLQQATQQQQQSDRGIGRL